MIHNLVEEHVHAAYESLRPRYPDFCGCDICRDDLLFEIELDAIQVVP